jgi:hypothetical protein
MPQRDCGLQLGNDLTAGTKNVERLKKWSAGKPMVADTGQQCHE